ncbi:chlorite dismutase family protein [uncultured Arthrobacter sp.]|uniref:chlorite dismutase family protein n=1 Tax=uncultured Arthrobacter sp. TaxID=114050 RepID=UPI0026013BCC|nr:chlorite dismutase family protein [uncultured Arthrobacter sp.]
MGTPLDRPFVAFAGGPTGHWEVTASATITGSPLPPVSRVDVHERVGLPGPDQAATWTLVGRVSNGRYTRRTELDALTAIQAPLGRRAASRAALIPIRKSPAWWALAQDERRAVLAERSQHISVGTRHAGTIARRLCHSRDLGGAFDFLTWFEFAPEQEPAFDELVAELRGSLEWSYVERESDIRLARRPSNRAA